MLTIKDRVRDGITDKSGVVVGIQNGLYKVRFDDGDAGLFLEGELYPDIPLDMEGGV